MKCLLLVVAMIIKPSILRIFCEHEQLHCSHCEFIITRYHEMQGAQQASSLASTTRHAHKPTALSALVSCKHF